VNVTLTHVVGTGIKQGQPTTLTVDVYDEYDEATGFRAMERLTGWHCSTMLALQVRGDVRAVPQEIAIPPQKILAGLRQRGIAIRETWA
jgi:lysine 6-dehydrogenase